MTDPAVTAPRRLDEILRTLVGSGVHGLAVEGTDDRDELGVYVEAPAVVVGLAGGLGHEAEPGDPDDVWRTAAGGYTDHAPTSPRSRPGDTDLTRFSLRKYVRLALHGNPTILLPLYAPDSSVITCTRLGRELRELTPHLVSWQAGNRFLGYMRNQLERMQGGGRQSRVPNRPELVAAHGYDCYLDDTEFLTRRGWLTYDRIGDEDIATIGGGGQLEFQRPVGRIAKPYSGPIHYGRTRYSSWAVTPNHRMWMSKVQRGASGRNGGGYDSGRAAWAFRRADAITAASWHQRVAATPQDEHIVPVLDEYLALVGAYISEGCVGKRVRGGDASVLRFEQKDRGRLHAIMTLVDGRYPMRRYRYPERRPVTTWTLADRTVANDIAKSCGEGSHNKRLPSWVWGLSARQAEVLLDALLAGDGTPYRTGGWVYYTISKQLAGDVQALAVMAGHRSNVWGPFEPAGMWQVFIAPAAPEREMEGFQARRHLTVEHVTDRRIVCFTVPNERLVTRRHGRVAMHGNTKYAAHALRLALQGEELVSTGRLTLPMPAGHRELVMSVRRGEWDFDAVVRLLTDSERTLVELLAGGSSPLPWQPNVVVVNDWMVRAHARAWRSDPVWR